MKILIDMNLSPRWVEYFEKRGTEAVHWSTLGKVNETDRNIMVWAEQHGYVVFTNDLDFGTLLAATQALAPSVVQVRTQNLKPEAIGEMLLEVLERFRLELEQGVLLTVDKERARVRVLPLGGFPEGRKF